MTLVRHANVKVGEEVARPRRVLLSRSLYDPQLVDREIFLLLQSIIKDEMFDASNRDSAKRAACERFPRAAGCPTSRRVTLKG